MRFLSANALVLALVMTAACGVEGGGDGESEVKSVSAPVSSGPTMMANSTPMGLFTSGGSLYWTSQDIDDVGPDFALVWSCGPNNVPGAESLLHQAVFDPNSTSFYEYDNIVGASVGGVPFLYFVYNYSVDGNAGSYILQMPSSGGNVTVIAASGYVAGRDLKTDGSNVFWSDSQFIYRVPVAGGTQATVVQDSSAVLALDSTFVYYMDGPRIRRVRKTGGPREIIFTAANPITALYVTAPASGPTGTVYWGEQGGAVRSVPAAGCATTTYQESIAGRTTTAVGFDGSRVLWIDCQMSDRTQCAVRKSENGVTTTVISGVDGAGHLQWDSTSMSWGQTGSLMRFVH